MPVAVGQGFGVFREMPCHAFLSFCSRNETDARKSFLDDRLLDLRDRAVFMNKQRPAAAAEILEADGRQNPRVPGLR